jgi:hypothetical protein
MSEIFGFLGKSEVCPIETCLSGAYAAGVIIARWVAKDVIYLDL